MADLTRTDVIDTLYSTTFARSKKQVINQVFKSTRLLTYLASKKKVQPRGGKEWRFPVLVGRNNTTTFIGPDGEVSTAGTDPVKIARFEPKFMVTTVKQVFTYSHMNAGKEQIVDMVETDINLARMEASQKLEEVINGDGSTTNGPEGFQSLVQTDPTSSDTIGGINQASFSWWRNQTYSIQGDAIDYLSKDMRHLELLCGAYGPSPDFVLCDRDVYEIMLNTIEDKHMFTDDKMKDLGWPDVPLFHGKPVIWSEEAQPETIRLVNLDDIQLWYDSSLWFDLGDWIPAQGNVNRVAHLKSALGMVCQRRATSGCLTSVDG